MHSSNWSVTEVVSWLEAEGFSSDWTNVFDENKIDGEALHLLPKYPQQLDEMGIPKAVGDRLKFWERLKNLAIERPSGSSSASSSANLSRQGTSELRKPRENFLEACIIIAGTIPQCLREYFKKNWQRIYDREWGCPNLEFSGNQYWNGDSSCRPEIRAEKSKTVKQYVERPKDGSLDKVLSGDICKWDQTLLSRILEYSSHEFTDSQSKIVIKALRDLRNEHYGHTPSASISDSVLSDLKDHVVSFCTRNDLVTSLAEHRKTFSENEKMELAWSCLILLDQQLEAECTEQMLSLKLKDLEPSALRPQASFRLIRNTLRSIIECGCRVSRAPRLHVSPNIHLDSSGSPPQQINSQSTHLPSAASSTAGSSYQLIVDDFPEVCNKGIGLGLRELLRYISEEMSALSSCIDVQQSHRKSTAMELNDTAVAMHFAGTLFSCMIAQPNCTDL
jgi:hypothetical protein